jgi:hypothetical protein
VSSDGRGSGWGRAVKRLLTPPLARMLCAELSTGDRTPTEAAARCGLRRVDTLRGWIAAGAAGDERYRLLVEAVVAGRRRVARRERAVAQHAAELLDAGDSLRAAAKRLGMTYEALRLILRRARAGDPELVELATAAHRRARAAHRPRVCPHCGNALGVVRHRGEEAA